MNYPSIKTITTHLAEPLRKQILRPEQAAATIRYYMKAANTHKNIDIALDEINKTLNGYGVEVLTDNGWDKYYANAGVLYVNMGDTYTLTVCYDTRKDRWLITSWGDLVEGNPKRFADR